MRWRALAFLVALSAGCDGTLRFAGDIEAGAPDAGQASTCLDACDGGQVCAPALQQCVTPCAEGATEHDCPASAPTCNEKLRYCVSCTSDEECADITDDGNICDVSTGQCVDCLVDSDCSDLQPRCDPGSQECVECLTSSDCPDQDLCDPAEMTCD